jgi:hypothetical protein
MDIVKGQPNLPNECRYTVGFTLGYEIFFRPKPDGCSPETCCRDETKTLREWEGIPKP